MNLYFTLHLLFNHLIFQVYYEFMHFKSVAFPQPFFGCLARFHFIFFCQGVFTTLLTVDILFKCIIR